VFGADVLFAVLNGAANYAEVCREVLAAATLVALLTGAFGR